MTLDPTVPAWPFLHSAHTEPQPAQKGTRTMSTFELETATPAKMTDVNVLSDKDRGPDANPGAAMFFTLTCANDLLSMFDGRLRHTLFCKSAASSPPAQGTITGVDPVSDLPNLTPIGKALAQFDWDLELTGYTLTFDHGLGGPHSDITIEDCTLSGWKILAKEGGSVQLKFKAEAPDVSEQIHGKLATLKAREVKLLLTPPEVVQEDVEQPVVLKSVKRVRQTPSEALAAQLGQ